MEIITVINEIYLASRRLDQASKEIFKLAQNKAESESNYRKELSKKIMELKFSGMSAGLIPDIARGEVSDLLLKREVDEGLYQSARESIRAIETQISALQTVSKYCSEVFHEI